MNIAPRPSPTRAQRRSVRLALRIRVIVRLTNNSQFDSETVTISRHGAKMRMGAFHRNLERGEHVRICQRGSLSWRTASIVWVDRVNGSYCGIELEDHDNFWGVYFPDKSTAGAPRDFTPLAVRKPASAAEQRRAAATATRAVGP